MRLDTPERSAENHAERPNAWSRFWFTPIDARGFHALRFFTGLLLLAWLGSFAGQQTAFFGTSGWMNKDAYAKVRQLDLGLADPRVVESRLQVATWSPLYLASSPGTVNLLYFASLAAAALFMLGIATRVTAPLAWLAAATFTANPILAAYGGDSLLLILTFYLMVGYILLNLRTADGPMEVLLGEPTAAVWRLGTGRPSIAANLALRLLQIHLAVLVFTTGLVKLQTGYWWGGIAFWFPLHPPAELPFEKMKELRGQPSAVNGELAFLSLLAYLTLAWQLSFPFIAWRSRWRYVVAAGAALGCLGVWWIYRLPVFGPALFIGSLAFLSTSDWRRLLGRFASTRRY